MAVIRQATQADVPQMIALQDACYPALSMLARWRPAQLENHQRIFPEGQLVAAEGNRVVGVCFSLITKSRTALQPHTFLGITGNGTFETHSPDGDALYGAEIMVHPEFRRRGIAQEFYAARFDLARRLRLRYFIAGGRIPGMAENKGALDVDAYVKAVVDGRLQDRVLSTQLRNGLRVVAVMPKYLNDPKSGGNATLLVWENPDFVTRPPVSGVGDP